MVLGTDRRVLVLALARMADAIANSFLIIVLPLYVASGAVSIEALVGTRVLGLVVTEELLIGVVLSLFGFLNSLSQPLTGRLSDRTGRRRVYILFGLGLLAVASAGYLVVESYYAVVLVRALQGIGAAFTIPCTIALVNELATTESRGGNFGLFNTFRLLGFGFGPIVAGTVVAAGPYEFAVAGGGTLSGFDAAFLVAVFGAVVSFGLVTLFVSDTEGTTASAGDDISLAVRDPDGTHLLDPVFTLAVATLCMAIGIALFATLQETINTRLDQPPFLFGAQFAAVVLANVVFQIPVGRASDRFGRRPFLVVGFALLVPSVLAQGIVTTTGGMLVARILHGVAVAMVFAPGLALAGDLATEGQSGTQLSLLTMAFGLGTALGPLASGYLVRFGFVVPFAFGAGLGVLGLLLVVTQVEETLPGAAEPDESAVPQD
ncbi:MFS transporter [Halorientalis litorea]|jgi:MFS family permease|uniref:MFS transporter n=1 Tax=Halorientalis litorea TaxID=2931977 RepID=UPI001FF6DC3F|nr:MFS transporter [Halorientalis litorea]